MIRNTREAISNALAHAYLGTTNTANFADYGCQIDKSSGNAAYIMANAVQMAKVRAAVNNQAPHVSAWLHLCYGPDIQSNNKDSKQAHIAATVTKEAFNGHHSYKMTGRLQTIAWLAVEDYRIGVLMQKELPVAAYLEALGYSGSQWARDYEPHRRAALMVLKGYDSSGVANVSIVVREICKSEEGS